MRADARPHTVNNGSGGGSLISSLVDLGLYALQTPVLQPVLERAVDVVCATLGTDVARVLELDADANALAVRAGSGAELGGLTTIATDLLAGQALYSGKAVIVDDPRTEHGAVSGASVIIHSDERHPYGVLETFTRTRRAFADDDVAFLQAVANVVGMVFVLDRAGETVRSSEQFLSIASHELRTPLAALQLQLDAIDPATLPAPVATKLARAGRVTTRLSKLVDTLLDVARLTSGHLELDRSETTLQDIVRDAVELVRDAALRAGSDVRIIHEGGGPLTGYWDRLRVGQVLGNLLDNALKYAPGTPVEISMDRIGDFAELVIVDHGPGIAPADARRIFDRYARATPSRGPAGLGLGLHIARQLIAAHGGTIEVESSSGRGARFILRIPLATEAAREERLQ